MTGPATSNYPYVEGDIGGHVVGPRMTPADGGAAGVRVLVACEYSATVRDAFRARGFDAWSCDLLATEGDPEWHIQEDLRHVLNSHRWGLWDLIVAHPPCTDLAVSGARHFAAKKADGRQDAALYFVRMILAANCEHIALENPVSIISSHIRKPDQIIQPWQYGHGETKATCLWLKGLPKLVPTDVVPGRSDRIHKMPPGPNRWKERSRTYRGIASAMASQWGDHLLRDERIAA
ncbi:hypothetical protein [Sphingomonas sp. T9W2]|uniref:hypothetical protein n=1 Tax=Sphingomonas sp. T9W2 TaxID=3143183 RepID=UPI0031F509AE